MRFVVAALAAFLALMLDFDISSSAVTNNYVSNSFASLNADRTEVVPASSSIFETASAGEELTVPAAAESAASSDSVAVTLPAQPASESAEPKGKDFCQALRQAAEDSGIPVAFFARLLWQESRFRSDEVSHAGARGVAQFMPQTAKEVGLDDPFDPYKAMPASAKFLRKLADDFGNLGLAAAAYNAGPGRIQKWVAKQSELPGETRAYVRIITGTKAEEWLDRDHTLSMRVDLPPEAPCEGVGGLAKGKDRTVVSVSVAPMVTNLIRQAELADAAAKEAASRARKRIASYLKNKKSVTAQAAKDNDKGKAKSMIVARASAKKPKPIRVASAAR